MGKSGKYRITATREERLNKEISSYNRILNKMSREGNKDAPRFESVKKTDLLKSRDNVIEFERQYKALQKANSGKHYKPSEKVRIEAEKNVAWYNRRISRATKNIPIYSQVIEPIKIDDVLSSKQALNSFNAKLANASRLGAMLPYQTEQGLTVPKFVKETIEANYRTVEKRKEKKRREILQTPVKAGGIETGTTRERQPDQRTSEAEAKRNKTEEIDNMRDFKAYFNNLELQRIKTGGDDAEKALRENYVKSLYENYPANIARIVERVVRRKGLKEFIFIYFSEENAVIKFNYDKNIDDEEKIEQLLEIWGGSDRDFEELSEV